MASRRTPWTVLTCHPTWDGLAGEWQFWDLFQSNSKIRDFEGSLVFPKSSVVQVLWHSSHQVSWWLWRCQLGLVEGAKGTIERNWVQFLDLAPHHRCYLNIAPLSTLRSFENGEKNTVKGRLVLWFTSIFLLMEQMPCCIANKAPYLACFQKEWVRSLPPIVKRFLPQIFMNTNKTPYPGQASVTFTITVGFIPCL